ncbi:MAG TPA: hypothetical protein PLS67_04315 [Accumulibacter sp.]|jgi:hypothetical protein|nr:hypothetical protein [Accumulibacter sp.]HQC79731.1 hypothetical protein [Accumulibacter sp.]
MRPTPTSLIPCRAQTLEILQFMGKCRPLMMLPGDDDGFGTRWVLDGQQVPPVIAEYLMHTGVIADTGVTEVGTRALRLTEIGMRVLENGVRWWNSLDFVQRLIVRIRG